MLSDSCEWHKPDELPALIMYHSSILDVALNALRLHLNHHPIGYNLLQEVFTMQ